MGQFFFSWMVKSILKPKERQTMLDWSCKFLKDKKTMLKLNEMKLKVKHKTTSKPKHTLLESSILQKIRNSEGKLPIRKRHLNQHTIRTGWGTMSVLHNGIPVTMAIRVPTTATACNRLSSHQRQPQDLIDGWWCEGSQAKAQQKPPLSWHQPSIKPACGHHTDFPLCYPDRLHLRSEGNMSDESHRCLVNWKLHLLRQ